MKKIVLIVALLCQVIVAKDFIDSSKFSIGVNLNTGANMGAGVEFGTSLYRHDLLELYNYLSLNTIGMKILNKKYDSSAIFIQEKLTLGYIMGSSLTSHIGFSYFRPYLFIAGGFGGLVGLNNLAKVPYYWEVVAGLGHEFISQGGHAFFFELSGGVIELTSAIKDMNANATGGIFRVLVGYRYYF